jgi:phosphoribosyl 1,2-cyclic phosphodiesterase
MFQTAVLASGSKGNCVLIRTAEAAVLTDVGISAKRVWAALDDLRFDRRQLKGILITHEHGDHILGVGAVSRYLQIPVFITRDTYIACKHRLGNLRERIVFIVAGSSFGINDLAIHPFSSSHDAVDSVNYTFCSEHYPMRKLAICTDLGFQTMLLLNHLKDCTSIVLESNHDEKMLKDGPYDWHLKQRILSKNGHLSNVQAVGVVSQIMHSGLKHLILAHLSEVNNHPDIALNTMQGYLNTINADTKLIMTDQYQHTPFIDI